MTNQEIKQKIKEEIERCKEHYKEELDSYWLGRIDALNFVSRLNDLKSKDDISEKPRTKIKLSEIIKNEKMVIYIPKEKQAKELCRKLNELGYVWHNLNSYLAYTNWNGYQRRTCYHIYNGTFGSTEYFLKNHCQVIEFENIDLEN